MQFSLIANAMELARNLALTEDREMALAIQDAIDGPFDAFTKNLAAVKFCLYHLLYKDGMYGSRLTGVDESVWSRAQ